MRKKLLAALVAAAALACQASAREVVDMDNLAIPFATKQKFFEGNARRWFKL